MGFGPKKKEQKGAKPPLVHGRESRAEGFLKTPASTLHTGEERKEREAAVLPPARVGCSCPLRDSPDMPKKGERARLSEREKRRVGALVAVTAYN